MFRGMIAITNKKKKGRKKMSREWVKEIVLSDHALKRAQDRVGWRRHEALKFTREYLMKATEIGEVKCEEDGNVSILFAYQGVAIHVAPSRKVVITMYRKQTLLYNPLKD